MAHPRDLVVICQPWEVLGGGRGIQPDGYSLHLSESARRRYVDDQGRVLDRAVATASHQRPAGPAYRTLVDQHTFANIRTSAGTVRLKGMPPQAVAEAAFGPMR